MTAEAFDAAARVLARAVEAGAFPAAVVEVGSSRRALWRQAFGRLGGPGSPDATTATVFDLASLTKVLATGPIVMRLVDSGRLTVDDLVARRVTAWRDEARAAVTVRDLLAHCAGLTGYLPLYRDHHGRREFERSICELPLEYAPRTRSVYSDLGFMLLGFIAQDAGGADLVDLFAPVAALAGGEFVGFRPPVALRAHIAPTGLDAWRGRTLVGEAHDQNAWALGGIAGHAGLFGSAGAVGGIAREVMRGLRDEPATHAGPPPLATAATLRIFARRSPVPGSSRALAWDTMLPTSSCGARMAPTALGHTGFTGTSLWIDWERDVYAVLLTNRVHTGAGNDAILGVRPAFHDAVMAALEGRGER